MSTFLVKAGVCFEEIGWFDPPLPFWEYRLVEAESKEEAEKKFLEKCAPDIEKRNTPENYMYKAKVNPIIVLDTVR